MTLPEFAYPHQRPEYVERLAGMMLKSKWAVRYQVPYGDCQWRTQWFATRDEAESMAAFYRSCGSPAHLV